MKRSTVYLLVTVTALVFLLSVSVSGQNVRVAVAEFRINEEDFEEMREIIDELFLEQLLSFYDRDEIEIKERIRDDDLYRDLYRGKKVSDFNLEKLDKNLNSDFLIMPRLIYFEIDEKSPLRISTEDLDKRIIIHGSFERKTFKVKFSTRIVSLETGTIFSGEVVEKEGRLDRGRVKLNERELIERKSSLIKAMEPAVKKLAENNFIDIRKIKDDREQPMIIETAPEGRSDIIIAEVNPSDDRFQRGERVRILRYTKTGARLQFATGKIDDRYRGFLTIKVLSIDDIDGSDMVIQMGDVIDRK